jgi:hypothetical protein
MICLSQWFITLCLWLYCKQQNFNSTHLLLYLLMTKTKQHLNLIKYMINKKTMICILCNWRPLKCDIFLVKNINTCTIKGLRQQRNDYKRPTFTMKKLIHCTHKMYLKLKWKNPTGTPGYRNGTKLLRLEGASVGYAGCINSQPTRPADET